MLFLTHSSKYMIRVRTVGEMAFLVSVCVAQAYREGAPSGSILLLLL